MEFLIYLKEDHKYTTIVHSVVKTEGEQDRIQTKNQIDSIIASGDSLATDNDNNLYVIEKGTPTSIFRDGSWVYATRYAPKNE